MGEIQDRTTEFNPSEKDRVLWLQKGRYCCLAQLKGTRARVLERIATDW